jgi:hypothetical protein
MRHARGVGSDRSRHRARICVTRRDSSHHRPRAATQCQSRQMNHTDRGSKAEAFPCQPFGSTIPGDNHSGDIHSGDIHSGDIHSGDIHRAIAFGTEHWRRMRLVERRLCRAQQSKPVHHRFHRRHRLRRRSWRLFFVDRVSFVTGPIFVCALFCAICILCHL